MRSLVILAALSAFACRDTPLDFEPGDADADSDGIVAMDDCNDGDGSAFPGADELCDGIDNNCDGQIDELAPGNNFVVYADVDQDGFGDEDAPLAACTAPEGYTTVLGDCDDTDAAYNPDAAEDDCSDPADYNCDGLTAFDDADEDGFPGCVDCNDLSADINPDAAEVCNGADDDCNGLVDDDPIDPGTFYTDADGDGHGDADGAVQACFRPSDTALTSDDCDDTNPSVSPDATERCNGTDDDCDGLVDNDALGSATWFADMDDDGYGNRQSGVAVACDAPVGFVSSGADCNDNDAAVSPAATEVCNGIDDNCVGGTDEGYDADSDGVTSCAGDCDDTNPRVSPGATERCNGTDDDCDGLVDNDALDSATWFADMDDDGYGNRQSGVAVACDAPVGFVSSGADCNDDDAAVSPAAAEVCNGIDDNCVRGTDEGYDADSDGVTSCAGDCDDTDSTRRPGAPEFCNGRDDDCDDLIDDADPDREGGSVFFTDADGDRFGDDATRSVQCEPTDGQVTLGGDCNDANALVFPTREERCNSIDDDCDGDIDESPIDGTRYFADTDGDGFGDGLVLSEPVCDVPADFSSDDTDCDDDDGDTFPGADEVLDGVDNDCDGIVDEGQPYGSGIDGPLVADATVDLSTWTSDGRTSPDGVSYGVIGISADQLTLDDLAAGIAPGDELLLVNLHGSDARHSSVGTWGFVQVQGVVGSVVTLADAIELTLGDPDNSDLSAQDIVAVRVPHYTTVTVGPQGRVTTAAWDGHTGGTVALRASEAVTVAPGGRFTVDALGYPGGDTGLRAPNCDAFQGESYAGRGEGQGNGSCNAYNEATEQWRANYGGGGAHVVGGGGEYAGGATMGESWNGGPATPPAAGEVYGAADLSTLFFGSGGGGVWSSQPNSPRNIGPGGAGGGILYVASPEVTAPSANAFTSLGETTPHWGTGTWTYGAGGGAGGSVYLVAADLSLAPNAIRATGGLGFDDVIRPGGDGGVGRVRIDVERLAGQSAPEDSALNAISEPDPGFVSIP